MKAMTYHLLSIIYNFWNEGYDVSFTGSKCQVALVEVTCFNIFLNHQVAFFLLLNCSNFSFCIS